MSPVDLTNPLAVVCYISVVVVAVLIWVIKMFLKMHMDFVGGISLQQKEISASLSEIADRLTKHNTNSSNHREFMKERDTVFRLNLEKINEALQNVTVVLQNLVTMVNRKNNDH